VVSDLLAMQAGPTVDDAGSAAHINVITHRRRSPMTTRQIGTSTDLGINSRTTQASTEAVEALAAAELAYRAANARFHAAVDARDYQGTEEARDEESIAGDALLVARDAVHNPARESAADALNSLDAAENDYSNASLAHTDTRTVESRQAVTDALNVFITARQVVRDVTGTPTYRRSTPHSPREHRTP